MSGWLIDILPPEAQSLVGIIAIAALLLGLLLWAAGLKIARAAVALLAGALGAAAAAWWLPSLLGFAPLTSALIGFALGTLLGAIGFRVLQGLTLAACLALAVAGGYYRWHVAMPDHIPPATAAASGQGVRASDLLIRGPLAAGTHPAPGQSDATFEDKLLERWNAILPADQTHIEIAALGTAAAVLLLAFAFARLTTWVATAALGAAIVLTAAEMAAHVYAPQWQGYVPGRLGWYLTLGGLALVGLVLQRWLFWPRDNSQPKSKMARGIDDEIPPNSTKKMGKSSP